MSGFLMGLVYYYDFTRRQQDVLLNLADHGNDDGTSIRPSIDTLAWKTGNDRRNIQKTIRELEKMGVLIPVAFTAGGRGHATEYEMHLPAAPVKPAPPPGEKMRRIWEMLKGGNTTAVSDDDGEPKGGNTTAVSDDDGEPKGGNTTAVSPTKGGNTTAVSDESAKGRYSAHIKGGNSRIKGGNSRIKGGTTTAPTIIEPSEEPPERTTRARRRPLATPLDEKTQEPEPEPEAPPHSAPPRPDVLDVPRWADFMREYRRAHGIASKYSEMHAAFHDTYGMTPDAARSREQEEVYA